MRYLIRLLIVVSLAIPALAGAENKFTRVDTDDQGRARALQLGIVTYAGNGVSVDLIGAVHVGDKAYYDALNERFRSYDSLLFELVAPEGSDFTKLAGRRKGLLSTAQVGLTKLLDLSFQLDEIDYGAENFVHADLSPKGVRESMAEREESMYTLFWRIFYASINEYAKDPLGLRDWQMLTGMVGADDNMSLKTMFAHQMTDLDQIQDILGDDSDSTIVGARNQRAIEVLHEQLDAGGSRIGIFYGVAHMPDLEERLIAMGLEYESTNWVDAWLLN